MGAGTPYIPLTDDDRRGMLQELGIDSVDRLLSDIPEAVRLRRRLNLPAAQSEMELVGLMKRIAAANGSLDSLKCFLGGGAYDHYVPSIVGHIVGRSEFYTAYTPYQSEISQGMLQSIFEYQSLMCELTGLDVSNASLYDGSTSVAEAAVASWRYTERTRVVVSRSVHPEYRQVLRTYLAGLGLSVEETQIRDGMTDLEALKTLLAGSAATETACIVMQSPNFFGLVEPMKEASGVAHAAGALFVACVDPISLAVLARPGDYGADIAVGEGQALGNPLSFGGPYLGFFACRQELVRKMPGRVSGQTTDTEGIRGFVLTLQAREQHVRREKATSNICSNEALCALAAAVYLCAMGKQGLADVARHSLSKTCYARQRIEQSSIPGCKVAFGGPTFKEFAVKLGVNARRAAAALATEKGILVGPVLDRWYPELGSSLLVCVTEKRTRAEVDELVDALSQVAGSGGAGPVGGGCEHGR